MFLIKCVRKADFFEKLSFILLIILVSLILIVKFWVLDKGLVFSDDGWYLLLLRDLPHGLASQFHLFFQNVFQNNIYLIRVTCYITTLISHIILAWGIYVFFKRRFNLSLASFFFILGFTVLGDLNINPTPSFNYFTMNLQIVELSFGLLLLGVARKNDIFLVFSGLFIGALFFVMVTNVVIIPLVLISLWLLTDKDVKSVLFYVSGVLVLFVLYFLFIQSPTEYIGGILENVKKTIDIGNSEYGALFLCKWFFSALFYLLEAAFIAYLFYWVKRFIDKIEIRNSFKKIIYIGCLVVGTAAILLFFKSGLFILYWICLFLFLYEQRKVLDLKDKIIFLLFCFTPVCLSFGTNISFTSRGYYYLSFITPLLFLLAKRDFFNQLIVYLLIIVNLLVSLRTLHFPNWEGSVRVEQVIPVASLNIQQNIKLSGEYIDILTSLQKYLKPGDNIIVDCHCWGYACLLDLNPLTYTFRLNYPEVLEVIVEQQRIDTCFNFGVLLPTALEDERLLYLIGESFPEFYSEKVIVEDKLSLTLYRSAVDSSLGE